MERFGPGPRKYGALPGLQSTCPTPIGGNTFVRNAGRFLRCLFLFVLTMSFSSQLWAHAVLMESTPSANATVSGLDIAISLRFNVRIDGGRSRIRLGSSDGTSINLPLTT